MGTNEGIARFSPHDRDKSGAENAGRQGEEADPQQRDKVVVNLLVVYYLDIVRLENGYRRVALFVFLNTNFGSAID